MEEAIVEHVPQGLRERTQHLLLRLPHRGIRIEAQALLQGREDKGAHRERRGGIERKMTGGHGVDVTEMDGIQEEMKGREGKEEWKRTKKNKR